MPVRMVVIEKEKNNKVCQGCGEKGILLHCGNVNWCSHMENSMELPQKIKSRTTI